MPMENCDKCHRCLPCPVTDITAKEGAYPISQDKGNIWFCTSCFYCEDVCPQGSPRQYAIHRRRKEQKGEARVIEPLQQIRAHGYYFTMGQGHNDLRTNWGLPPLLQPNLRDLEILFQNLLGEEEQPSSTVKPKSLIKLSPSLTNGKISVD